MIELSKALRHLYAELLRSWAPIYRWLHLRKTYEGMLAWADRIDPHNGNACPEGRTPHTEEWEGHTMYACGCPLSHDGSREDR